MAIQPSVVSYLNNEALLSVTRIVDNGAGWLEKAASPDPEKCECCYNFSDSHVQVRTSSDCVSLKPLTLQSISLIMSFALLVKCPICSVCVSTFGARPVIFFSGFMVAGGLMLSSVAPSIYFLFFSYGILVGLGCGLLYTATVTATCQYFDKRRGLALGLISTGSSLGLFIYAALQRELIELYDMEGCLMIVGAISLNILACGILMRPLESPDTSTIEKPHTEGIQDQNIIYHEKELNSEEMLSILEKCSSLENGMDLMCNGNSKKPHINLNNALFLVDSVQTDTLTRRVADHKSLCKRIAKTKCHMLLHYWEDTVFLFRNKVFSALFIAIFLFDIGGFPPTLLLEDIAKSADISEEAYFIPLVSIMGISTVIGKLFLGFLADFTFINTLYLYVFTLLGTGLALVAIPFAQNYSTLAILAAILGFFSGNWSIFPYVTTKTVGLEKLTHAYGILMFFAGIGNCLGPPIVGWFFDWTQTYDIAFYFSGVCVFLGGLLLLLAVLPGLSNCSYQTPNKPPIYRHSYNAAPLA